MLSQDDSSLRNSEVGNVFIKNLDRGIDDKALYVLFSAFGNISSCKIVTDEHGSRGYAFVNFETEESARSAIEKVNGLLLNGKQVVVERFMNHRERLEVFGDKLKRFYSVYVKNFGDEINEAKLTDMFHPYGKIISAKVMRDKISGISRGFGFVNFEDPDAAEKAVEALNDFDIGGRSLYVGCAKTKTERQAERMQGVNVYVKNLDDNIDDERLRKEFSEFGTITSAKVMRKGLNKADPGRSKGFGFVCFSSPEEATKAIIKMNGKIVISKPLYVALAQSKEDRRAHLASEYKQRIASMRIQNQQMGQIGQMFQPGNAGYFVPTMPQAQRSFFAPTQMQQMRASPRWQTHVRPTNPGETGFQTMPPQMTQPRPSFQEEVCGGMSSRPIANKSDDASARPGLPVPQTVPQQAMAVQGQEPLTASMLAAAQPQEQKLILGERLLPLIQCLYPDLAFKITVQLLQIDNSELLNMLESNESLEAKVKEIVAELQAQQAEEAQQVMEAASK